MINIISIIFEDFFKKETKFIYRMNNLTIGAYIIAKTENGTQFGKVISIEETTDKDIDMENYLGRLIIRKANKNDFEIFEEIKKLEIKVFSKVRETVENNKVNMKIISVKYTFDKKKLMIYFSSEERADFRKLLSEFIKMFKVWIEFKQVNVRQSSKVFGGIGICGNIFCCCSFLKDFKRIDMQVAVNQGMMMDSSKLCGGCGRLLCCLKYEEETYASKINMQKNC